MSDFGQEPSAMKNRVRAETSLTTLSFYVYIQVYMILTNYECF